MKQLRKKIHCHPVRSLVIGCYAVWLLGLVLLHLFGFVANRVLHQNGTLATAALTADDFTLVEMVQQGDVLVTTGTDPQLVLKDTTRKIDAVRVDFTYSLEPYLVNVFYTAGPGQDYSDRNMAYPRHTAEGDVFQLPATGGQQLRIDPGSVPGNGITINAIVVNEPRLWWSFFALSAGEWVLFALVPGLAACAVSLVREGLAARKGAGA